MSVLIGSLQATDASLLALFQLGETLRENWKIKGKTEFIHNLLFPSFSNTITHTLNNTITHALLLIITKTVY